MGERLGGGRTMIVDSMTDREVYSELEKDR
jgi:hypothetical protein